MSGLNRPYRWLIAGVELVLTVALVVTAVLLWRDVNYEIAYTAESGRELVSTRMRGDLAGACIGLCLIAAFVLLDAIRQAVLAMNAGHRRAEGRELAAYQRMEEQERSGTAET